MMGRFAAVYCGVRLWPWRFGDYQPGDVEHLTGTHLRVMMPDRLRLCRHTAASATDAHAIQHKSVGNNEQKLTRVKKNGMLCQIE